MDHFVKTVKSFPCLWDTTHPAYKDFEVMDQAWAKVAAAADYPDARAAKVQWKKLRDNFREALKRQKDSKYAGRTWRYQRQMQFLVPFMQSKNQDFNVDADRNSSSENAEATPNADDKKHNFLCSFENDANDSASSSVKKKRRISEDQKDDLELSRSSIVSGNALLDFFSSMYNTTEELPPHLQLQVKRKIFEVVAEAEETALMMQQQEYDAEYFMP
ncbi:MADF domain-containing protein [Trichonephila inaurata madagascariensis]|uniref:MADF domain-containing protein n=1 Tax=Trichonephila inaurata madagascariensis TaxID=2747483 RepID=A0A8X7CDS0_9ARAC|nr:MADF domain-containing protein [Trichonephila inaurata madagascariensis]